MRPIDADELIKTLNMEKIPYNADVNYFIEHTPTIDPVKHGKWIWQDSPVFGNPYGSYMCPLCQNTMPHKTNYCPNCGAKMDGGEG